MEQQRTLDDVYCEFERRFAAAVDAKVGPDLGRFDDAFEEVLDRELNSLKGPALLFEIIREMVADRRLEANIERTNDGSVIRPNDEVGQDAQHGDSIADIRGLPCTADDGERLTVGEAFSLFTSKEGEAIVVVLGLDSEYKPTIPSIAVDAACLARDEGWDAPYRYYDRYHMGRFPVRAVWLDGWKIFIQVEDEDEGVAEDIEDTEAEDVEDTESSPTLVS